MFVLAHLDASACLGKLQQALKRVRTVATGEQDELSELHGGGKAHGAVINSHPKLVLTYIILLNWFS